MPKQDKGLKGLGETDLEQVVGGAVRSLDDLPFAPGPAPGDPTQPPTAPQMPQGQLGELMQGLAPVPRSPMGGPLGQMIGNIAGVAGGRLLPFSAGPAAMPPANAAPSSPSDNDEKG